MPEKQSVCFDGTHLSKFLHEQLSEKDESSVILHLNDCPECQSTLESVAADGALWSDLHEHFRDGNHDTHPARGTTPRDQIVDSVMDFLGPTDNPNMMGRLGSYEVCGIVGRGSTGIVLKAFEPRLNRYVAIKVLAPNFASSGSARARFEREARAVAAVAHEHVVPIFAVDEFRNLPYLVMQYAGGGSLQQRIELKGPLDACEVVRVGMQVASGLAAAHAQGIVHRDVKPANVMLEGGVERAMVTDFGLARVADEASMTRSGAITGTPQFMSPEQAKGEYIDHRSDLFSLGSLMYTACTGRPPFRSETVYGVIRRVCETNIRPVREINPNIPEWLGAFIAKLCEKDREKRFQTAEEVRNLLSRELAHLQAPGFAKTPERTWITTTQRRSDTSRKPTYLMIKCAVALTVAAALAWSMSSAISDRSNSADDIAANKPNGKDNAFVASEWNAKGLPVFESHLTRAVPVEPGGRLRLLANNADIQFLPSNSQQLEVRVVRKVAAVNHLQAQEIFPSYQLRFLPDEAGIVVKSNVDEPEYAKRFGKFSLRVYVPNKYGIDVSMLSSDCSMSSIDGQLTQSSGQTLFQYAKRKTKSVRPQFLNFHE